MEDVQRTVRLNLAVFAGAMALNWAVIVLVAALTTLTVAHFFGLPELAGLVFGLYLLAYAAGGLVVGRLIDAWGRRNGLIAAFVAGSAGAAIVYLGILTTSLPVTLFGLLAVGLGGGGANLSRVAGADMYPAARRARGVAVVLFGAAFGSIGAPILFGPVLAGARSFEREALAAPWPIAALVMLGGALLLLAVRVDPRQVGERLGGALAMPIAGLVEAAGGRPLAQLLTLPMVPLALLAAIIAQGVMTVTMALAGLVLADAGHDLGAVSLTVSVHFLGMFGLVLIVGRLVEAIGRFSSVIVGLVVLAGGMLALLPGVELANFMPGMFAVGVGWNIAFVASTTILADAARSSERGRLLGMNDFIAISGAAAMSVVAGLILAIVGLSALIVVGVLLALVPAALIMLNRARLEGAMAEEGAGSRS